MTNPTFTTAGASLGDTIQTVGLSIRHAVMELGDGDTRVTALDVGGSRAGRRISTR
jgi:putative ABC transport system ATP-binding protein